MRHKKPFLENMVRQSSPPNRREGERRRLERRQSSRDEIELYRYPINPEDDRRCEDDRRQYDRRLA